MAKIYSKIDTQLTIQDMADIEIAYFTFFLAVAIPIWIEDKKKHSAINKGGNK